MSEAVDKKAADGAGDKASAKIDAQAYWRSNLRLLGILLTIWFVVSYGCGIIFADALNSVYLGGFPLGFWFAQQGAIYVFTIMIFVYAYLMNRMDKDFGVSED